MIIDTPAVSTVDSVPPPPVVQVVPVAQPQPPRFFAIFGK